MRLEDIPEAAPDMGLGAEDGQVSLAIAVEVAGHVVAGARRPARLMDGERRTIARDKRAVARLRAEVRLNEESSCSRRPEFDGPEARSNERDPVGRAGDVPRSGEEILEL